METQRQPGVVCIGPAGEKRSLIAGISHDFGRMAARSGLGAVMGSKNLKAVVLAGAKPIPVADPQAMKALCRKPAKITRFQIPLSSRMMALAGKFLRNPWIADPMGWDLVYGNPPKMGNCRFEPDIDRMGRCTD
jgi:aldehyde:ferredoxin oxidoreductase